MPSGNLPFGPVALSVLLTLAAFGTGCASQPKFAASSYSVKTEHVLVEFVEQDDDVFKFQVYSRSDAQLLIQRDQVFLVQGGERISRTPGGLKSVYELPPGGAHQVFVAYDLAQLEGRGGFSISFETAITAKGEPVEGPVLDFTRLPE